MSIMGFSVIVLSQIFKASAWFNRAAGLGSCISQLISILGWKYREEGSVKRGDTKTRHKRKQRKPQAKAVHNSRDAFRRETPEGRDEDYCGSV